MRYLGRPDNQRLSFVYAFTVGTKGKAWTYKRFEDYLEPMFGDENALGERREYVELHSTDASYLRTAFRTMTDVRPQYSV